MSVEVRRATSSGSRLLPQRALAREGGTQSSPESQPVTRGKLPTIPPPSSGHRPNLAAGLLEHCIKLDLHFLRFPVFPEEGAEVARGSSMGLSACAGLPCHSQRLRATSRLSPSAASAHVVFSNLNVKNWPPSLLRGTSNTALTVFMGEVKTRRTAN